MKNLINIVCFFIPIPSVRRQTRRALKDKWDKYTNNPMMVIKHLNRKPIILWIDHALGGGTEVYSKHQFKILRHKYDIIRMQYFPATELYHITHTRNKNWRFKTNSLDDIYQFCCGINICEIVLNNIVAYKSATDILDFVKKLKQNAIPKPCVSFRGHDFHCMCPSFNLINCDGNYCALKYDGGCEKCWRQKKLAADPISHNILKSGATDVCTWRTAWGNFLENTADSVIVFSKKIAELFIYAYPQIKNKVQVIPHTVREYKTVKIKPHNEINIAVLGTISQVKGANVIRDMAQHLPDGTSIKIIGTMKNKPDNIFAHGKYKARNLPRIMQKHKIDLVFIPSVWPETFSYTTSEAMSMGLPVACYDMGAPAERISKYSRGLILNKISPKENLIEIIKFIKKQRQQL